MKKVKKEKKVVVKKKDAVVEKVEITFVYVLTRILKWTTII